MNRKERQEFLEQLEQQLSQKKVSKGKIVYEVLKFFRRKTIIDFIKHIHPQDYKNKYPKSFEFFNRFLSHDSWGREVRNYSVVDKRLLISLLEKRPGELVRRFPKLLLKLEGMVKDYSFIEASLKTLEFNKLNELRSKLLQKNRKKEIGIYTYTLFVIDDLLKNKEAN